MLGGLASGRNDGCGRSGQDSSTNISITTPEPVRVCAGSRNLSASSG